MLSHWVFGVAAVGLLYADQATHAMGADGRVAELSGVYLRLRLIGLPAMLASLAAFGALRGAQDMRTPLWIAAGMNALNLVLDPLLIFGWGWFPAMGTGRGRHRQQFQPVDRGGLGGRCRDAPFGGGRTASTGGMRGACSRAA